MNIPTMIENSPAAVRVYQQMVNDLGLAHDPGGNLLALYASIRADVEALQDELAVEGTILVRQSGSKYANPKVRMLTSHRKQLLSAARALGLTAKTNGGKRPAPRRTSLREMLDSPPAPSAQSLI